MNKEPNAQSSRVPIGWPEWELKAQEILNGIRRWAERGDENSDTAFYAAFLPILDAFLSQLISWTEQKNLGDLHRWAGRALADRWQFLSAQRRDWSNENEGFKRRRAEFGDRRRTRSPRSYLGWLTGDYLRKLVQERIIAGVMLLPARNGEQSASFAERAGYSEERILWLKKLCALPDFSRDSASGWADVVFERMQQDEQKILASPEMRKCKTRDSNERRRTGKVRLYDFKRTIVGAVERLVLKPVGQVRGITRPV